MELPRFELDHWLNSHEFGTSPIRFNLGSSTGPKWTIEELRALPLGRLDLSSIPIGYAPPEGSRELREAIAEHIGVDPDWVVVTTGASEALLVLFCLASRRGANIILPTPNFPAFAALAQAWHLQVKSSELRRDEDYRLTADRLLALADEATALALINSPHNPTGTVVQRAEIEHLAAGLGRLGAPLIVDEVYHPLYFGAAATSAAGLDNVIAIGDFSKALSLAGLRIGWIVDSDPDRRNRIIDARSYFTISNSPLTEAIAAHALRNRAAILDRLTATAAANLAMVQEVIQGSNILSWVRPTGGTTCFPWFNDGRNSRAFCEQLAAVGVLIVPGDCFDQPAHVRIGFGAQEDDFQTAAAMIGQALSG